jgi:SpoVK/Ycf46/Vps4 family AAA+-type ATPase
LGETLACTINHGARALFVGDSGTGKTLAASYVATCLGAPLYRVDLASVMNKYVGESEKNLGRLLDLAAAVDVVLLFDEADAVFGSRNEGSETGERYANMLTNFLLTRIEQHPGIVILTANSRSRIDQAFTRRLDTIIEFPLPGPSERFALWRAHLGQRSPGDEACRWIAGHCGIVRNAVLSAAAGSGADDLPLSLPHLVRAIEREYRKMGRTMPAALATVQE